nr:hypothetical protein BaRGS_000818 [Batillaria attramentaria]
MRVEKAVKQLNKADVVLRQLVSDLAPVKVTKILMLPNLTSTQLQQALDTNPHVEQDLLNLNIGLFSEPQEADALNLAD